MAITDMRMVNETVLRLIQDQILLWDRNAEDFADDLVLWVPGVNGLSDKSESGHALTPSGNLGNTDHLEFRNAQYIDLPDNVGYVNQLTVTSWFRSVGAPLSNHHIVLGGAALELTVHQTGYLRTGLMVNGVRRVANFPHPNLSLTDGQWHHIGFSFNGSKMRRFIDGLFVGETTLPAGTLNAVFSDRRMGRFGNSSAYYSNGDVYDLRIYNVSKADSFFDQVFRRTNKSSVKEYVDYTRCRLG